MKKSTIAILSVIVAGIAAFIYWKFKGFTAQIDEAVDNIQD